MKNLFILSLVLIVGCELSTNKNLEAEKAAVLEAWTGLYEAYSAGNLEEMLTYYEDDVIRMGTSGTIQKGKEKFRKGWQENYRKNEVEILDYSNPTILMASDHVTTYNTYDEIFISKNTNDTTSVTGTWIAIWKKQEDGSWKARMTTWHLE